MKVVVMAGGGGTRLWPLSRNNQPKQFSKVFGDKTLFEETVHRFLSHFPINDVYIALTQDLLSKAKDLFPVIPERNYIIEPEKRDTAPAMGLSAAYLYNYFPDEPIVYVPADHFIADTKKFLSIIKYAEKLILETGKMVDIAIWPTFPSTVLGYTQVGNLINTTDGIEVYEFLGHTEKPEFEIDKKYLEAGNYLWHASYYMWTPRRILEAFGKHSPEHHGILNSIIAHLSNNAHQQAAEEFKKMPKISFDYAVTEKIDPSQVLIIKGNFGWSDVGAFDVLYETQKNKVDRDNNLVYGKCIGRNTANCYIHNDSNTLIATSNVDDLVIINTADVILICPKGKAQEVKNIVQKLKDENLNDYL